MDCNKEEAIRAKGIAEKKMRTRDFSGAFKVAIKAQKLFQDLENISQMITVCDVHCAAEKRLFDDELDWYAILKVEPTADVAEIKKQYRKLALLIHPDKNKFPGAGAAFQLIRDAQTTLLDQGKRSAHDMKCKVAHNKPAPTMARQTPQKPRQYPHEAAHNNSQHQQQQPTQTGSSSGQPTFWTMCPYCRARYQYYKEVLHKSLRCRTCHKIFFSYDFDSAPHASKMRQGACKVDQGSQRNFTAESVFTAFSPNAAQTSEVGTEKVNDKRGRKQSVESGQINSGPEEDVVVDENGDVLTGKKFDSQVEPNVRISGRRRQHISCKENSSDEEDVVNHPKKAKKGGSPSATQDCEEMPRKNEYTHKTRSGSVASLSHCKKESVNGFDKKTAQEDGLKENEKVYADGVKRNSNTALDDSVSDTSFKETKEPQIFAYPAPEFYDFDKDKEEGCFSVGQVWALYDTLDAMPRFYAQINKVFCSGFKMRITWLEPDPDDENEINWVSEGLPVSCGKFKLGQSENTDDCLMFSQLLCSEKCTGGYKIFPRKGETWALYKNWNIKWKSDTDTDQIFKYEFVEILVDNGEDVGIHVAYLTKVKGFESVFCRMSKDGVDTFLIPPNELFRFSHKVPSFPLTGQERKGLPKYSFELDPASLPEENFVPDDLKVDGDTHLNGTSPSSSETVKPVNGSHKTAAPHDSTPKEFQIPYSEFYDFDADKSQGKFSCGQFWALYSDEDGLPKYYGKIKKIESNPVFKIHVKWLLPYPLTNITTWFDACMPSGCGRFRFKSSQVYTSTDSFSHRIKAEPTIRKDEYFILPRKGEIWALYRNWTPEIKCSDLKNWEYDIVQVMEEMDFGTKVLVLAPVDGFKSVFKAQVKGGSIVTMEISWFHQLRFSHQIPFFRLTDERNGSLRGCLELDPAALPAHYLSF